MAMLTALRYMAGTGWTALAEVGAISEVIQQPGALLWAYEDIANLSSTDVQTIAEEFGLHPLAVEDAINPRQRPKYEPYEGHMFAVMHQLDAIDGQFEAAQIACFIGHRWVIALHSGASRTIDEALARMRQSAKAEDQGPSFVMHALLDTIADDYGTKADELEEEIEELEERALGDRRLSLQDQLYSVKQRIARLRRYSLPGERVLAAVVDVTRAGTAAERTATYFRDVHDHLLRIIDQIRTIDDLADAVIDLQRAHQSDTLNQGIKRLSGWAAIIAVPTFIASVYGMNFELLPNEGSLGGFVFALSLMAISSTLLFRLFKRRDWI